MCCTAIYRKSLYFSSDSRAAFNTGQLVNCMSVDCSRLDSLCQFIHMLWSAPLQIIISIILLLHNLGVAALASLVIVCLLLPLNNLIVASLRKFRQSAQGFGDTRIKTVTEILMGIRIIKFYAW